MISWRNCDVTWPVILPKIIQLLFWVINVTMVEWSNMEYFSYAILVDFDKSFLEIEKHVKITFTNYFL